jgi:hypothetical protein
MQNQRPDHDESATQSGSLTTDGKRQAIIDHSDSAPDHLSTDLDQSTSTNEKEPPTPVEFVAAVTHWLRHWWEAPREKSKAADWMLVVLTVLIAGAAFWSAFIFRNQLHDTSEAFRIDERAWVGLEPIKAIPVAARTKKIGAAFNYPIYIRNFGKTVARDVQLRAARSGPQSSITMGDNAERIKWTQEKLLTGAVPSASDIPTGNPVPKVLAPNTTSPVPITLYGQEPQYFSKDEWVSYIIGRIDYTDAFGVPHWVKFCFFVADAQGNLWNCKEGNDEDNNLEMPKKPN